MSSIKHIEIIFCNFAFGALLSPRASNWKLCPLLYKKNPGNARVQLFSTP